MKPRRIFYRTFASVLALFAQLLHASIAFGHSSERGLVMLLPTGFYMTGGTLVVAATFLLLALVPTRILHQINAHTGVLFSVPAQIPRWPGWFSFVLLALLVVSGFTGTNDPLLNPLPLFIWTLWWVGFTLLQFLVGDLWVILNPWSAVVSQFRKLTGQQQPTFNYSERLGYVPAIVLFSCFALFELVDLAPEDPYRLATYVTSYWLLTFVGCVLFGEQIWLRYGEPFSLIFRLIGSCSPFIRQSTNRSTNIRFSWPGQRLITLPALPISGVILILLFLSSVSFDGFSKTFSWLGFIEINPLAFPGRSVVVMENTLGLITTFVCLTAAYFFSVYSGCVLSDNKNRFVEASGRLVYSIAPILLAFHFAHFLTVLLTNSQYALRAFSDPYNLGWDLLGTRDYMVTTSYLNDLHSVAGIWGLQTGAIVLGHITGIVVAHLIAVRLFGSAGETIKSQLMLAALMVFYTLFGLWLLSTPTMS